MAQLRLEPERVKQIQQALIQAGYLHTEPNGKWDAETHDAMRRYQAENGFAETGLPEAKPLMKLGLGPHELPHDVDPHYAGQKNTQASVKPPTPGSPDPPREKQ